MHALSSSRGALALLALLLLPLAATAHEFVATVTLAEGGSALISGSHGYLPAAGVPLRHADIIQTGPKAFVQIEIDDGGMMELGPATRFLVDLPYVKGEEPVIGPHFLLRGWVKITVPKRAAAGPPHRINTPFFDLVMNAGVAVLQVSADAGQVFIESGEGIALEPSGRAVTRVAVRAGRMFSRKAGQKGALTDRPAAAFIQAMPAEFRDTLPPRLAKLKVRDVKPKPGPEYTYADVEDWLKSESQVRHALLTYMRAKVSDAEFRAALIQNMQHHAEWNAVLGR